MKVKIYYHHTDTGGVVYYARYLDFLEEARTEFLEERGVFVKELIPLDTLFVVARQEIDYRAPSFYGDTLNIDTVVTDISGVRITFENTIKNQEGRLVAEARTIMVCVDKNIKPRPIPAEVAQKINYRGLTSATDCE